MAIDYTMLMNPQWAKWLDIIKANSPDGQIRLGGQFGQRPSIQGLGRQVKPGEDPYAVETPSIKTPTSYTPTLKPSPATPYDNLPTNELIAQSRANRRRRRSEQE